MKVHRLIVSKSFKIKNTSGHSVILPEGYRFVAQTTSYQKNLVEMWSIHCEADGDMLENNTRIWDVPSDYLRFADD